MNALSTASTRRALLTGAALAIPALIAPAAALAADQQTYTQTELDAATADAQEEAYQDGLWQLTVAWLNRWRVLGGSVTPQGDSGAVSIGYPAYHYSPAYDQMKATRAQIQWNPETTEEDRQRQDEAAHAWMSPFYSGQTRAMLDLLDACPELEKALKSAVRELPELGRPPVREA